MSGAEAARVWHLDDAHCADVALGLLPPEAHEATLAHAAQCPACEARLQAHVSAAERARADWRTRAPRVVRGRGVPPATAWGIAAALLALVIALPLLRPHAARDAGPWLPAMGEAVRTRDIGSADAHLAAGLRAYQSHDLATAARELSAAHASGGAEQARRLYLAHVELARGDADGALALLRALDWRSVPEPWRRAGVALYARALRRGGHPAEADSIEQALRATPPGTPFVP